MTSHRLILFFVTVASLSAQIRPFVAVPDPPLPADAYEPVTIAEPTQDASQRATVVNMLNKARDISNLKAQPYNIKTAFTVSNSPGSDGSWEAQDTFLEVGAYRWTVQGPGYSAVNLYSNHILYSNQPTLALPLRVAQLRAAMFFAYLNVGPRTIIRMANASYNGQTLLCGLISFSSPKAASGPRLWDEAEYCADSQTGALVTYSLVPGVHVIFDYSHGIKFHGKLIHNKLTLVEAGQPVLEARTLSVADPTAPDPGLFKPDGLNQIGFGNVLSPPWRYHYRMSSPQAGQNTGDVVVLRGLASPQGAVSEIQVLASSNQAVNPTALEFVSRLPSRTPPDGEQPGTTPQSHEVMMTVRLVPRRQLDHTF